MADPKPRECELWRGADRMVQAMEALDENVDDHASISSYLGSSRVILAEDEVISEAFGEEFLQELNAPV